MKTKVSKPPKKQAVGKGAPPAIKTEEKKSNNLTKKPPSELVTLNFWVTAEFRKRFRLFAAEHDMKHIEILNEAFDEFEKSRS